MNALSPYLPQWYSLWIIWTLLALDVVSTKYAIEHLGAHEANPAMALLMQLIGNVQALVITHLGAGYLFYRYFGEIGIPAMWCVTAMFALVVGNNLRLIVNARG